MSDIESAATRVAKQAVLARADLYMEKTTWPDPLPEVGLRAQVSEIQVRNVSGSVGPTALSGIWQAGLEGLDAVLASIQDFGEAHA